MSNAPVVIVSLFLLTACGPDLPEGWGEAKRVEELAQAECSGTPYENYQAGVTAEKAGADAVSVAYSNAHFRCEQEVEGFWREAAGGLEILVQPQDMNPSMVADCDCLYDVTMSLPVDAASGTVTVFRRWDNLNEPNDPLNIGQATF